MPRAACGFTLIEILVVLVIAGLIVGIALPRLQLMVQSIEMAGQRRDILGQIDALGYRAFSGGRALRLGSLPEEGDFGDPPVQLPPGWRLEAQAPVEYSFSGVCGGGKLTLISPDQRAELLELKPPLCRATEG